MDSLELNNFSANGIDLSEITTFAPFCPNSIYLVASIVYNKSVDYVNGPLC